MNILKKIFGDPNTREVNKYQGMLDRVNSFERELEKLSEVELKNKALELKKRISQDSTGIVEDSLSTIDKSDQRKKIKKDLVDLLEPDLPYAFALVREASKRILGMRHFDVQLVGGAVLHHGHIAEMATGEGKTLVATLPLFLNGLTGLGAHLVTVNDYLARRDGGWMAPVYDALGLTVGIIGPQFSYQFDPEFTNEESDERLKHLRPVSRREAYLCDITYGTNNEFGFDYLRDNMVGAAEQMSQRDLAYAIVDEVDSILIDEARTPLIISSFSSESAEHYRKFASLMPKLKVEQDYTMDEKTKNASLTDAGIKKLESLVGIENLYSPENASLVHYADATLKAYAMFKKNKDYVVKDGEVIIVDEFTGRMLQGRRYSNGLHQAIEAKEGVRVQEESITLATITFQNYFRLYYKLSGMTGTAVTEAEEFSKIYNLEVVTVPTNRPSKRVDLADEIYKTENSKFNAVVKKVGQLQEEGKPVLIGTVSIQKSEKLSKMLKAAGIKHSVLNAKQHQKEGEVISQAGLPGSVTVATNMAGRGVDIVLGGVPPTEKDDVARFKDWESMHEKILELGGLHVIATERHESRRIDNQLRGRAARQGDPGVTQFFLSMEDDLMRIFGGDRMKNVMEKLNIPDDMSINNKLLSRAIEQAQTRVEGYNFDTRKQLVEYDDVMNKQREAVYNRRRLALFAAKPEDFQALSLEIEGKMTDEERTAYLEKAKAWPAEAKFQVERAVFLKTVDTLWVEHLTSIESLRESIGLRGYGQRDPIVEYKQEAYHLFMRLNSAIDEQIVQTLLHLQVEVEAPKVEPRQKSLESLNYSGGDESSVPAQADSSHRIGRNDPCPCGAIDPATNKVYKYKKCGLINASYHKS